MSQKVDQDLEQNIETNAKLTVETLKRVLGQDGKTEFDFRCTGCGNCCKGGGAVFFSQEDIRNIAEYLKLNSRKFAALKQEIIQYKQNGYFVHDSKEACYFLDKDNRCTIYPVRPVQCGTYPFWPSLLESKEGLDFLKTECPGTLKGKGESFSLLQTVRRVNKTHKEFLEPQENKSEPLKL